jgi:BlaI family transcriptional regulator, penicillinase repressor
MARSPDLTSAELRVMKALWELGRGSVADVRGELHRRGHDVAYTTVMTLLGRLAAKHAVAVDRSREPFVYKPATRRESVLGDRLRDFVREVFDGHADSLVLRLVEDESLTRAELRAIERKIDAAESRAAESRTAESRTAESRTAESRTAESRTAESRTAESRTRRKDRR